MSTIQMIRTLFALLIFTLISCTTTTDHSNKLGEELSKYFNYEEMDQNPGISIFVSLDGKPVFQKSIGMADIDRSIKITAESTFRIGSITKQFTATAILLLKERDLLEFDDTLNEYIPDFPQGELVTIYHLLTHTSGIKSYTEQRDFFNNVTNYIETSDLIDQIKLLGYDFQPGEKWQYNNSGYFILGYIIEMVSEKSYGEFLNDNIFIPLNMTSTGVYRKNLDLPNEAIGYDYYQYYGIKEALNWDMSYAGGAGNLYSNVLDLFLWNEALFNGKVLSEESLNEALTPTILNNGEEAALGSYRYGLGWVLTKTWGFEDISHSGGLHGFSTLLTRLPESNATIIVLMNKDHNSSGFHPATISNKIIQILFNEIDENN